MIVLQRFILVFIISISGVSFADDPVFSFNARRYWGVIDGADIGYNESGDVIFKGYKNQEGKKKKYYFNISKKIFEKHSLEIEFPSILENYKKYTKYSENNNENKIQHSGVKIIDLKISVSFYFDKFYKKINNVDIVNAWFILIPDIRRKFIIELTDYDKDPQIYTYFDFDYNLRLSREGDLYLFPEGGWIVYRIPRDMRGNIIIRENFVYAPVRYLLEAWDKIPGCSYKEIDHAHSGGFYQQETCLISFFNSRAKGDYDADSFELITPR